MQGFISHSFLPHKHRAVTKTSSYWRKVGNWTTSYRKFFCFYFPLNLLNSSRKRVYNFVDCARIARGVWFCFGHKSFSLSVWYLELPSNDVMTKLQLTSFSPTSHLGAFFGFQATLKWQLEIWPRTTKKKTTTRNRGDERRMWLFILCEKNVYCCWIMTSSPHVNAENCKLYNTIGKRLCNGFARHLISLCLPCVLQMWWRMS